MHSAWILLSIARLIPAQPGGVEISSFGLGSRYSTVITHNMLKQSPIWKSDNDNPPVSARRAIKIAEEKKAKLVKNDEDWEWTFISATLKDAGSDRWYWIISFEAEFKRGNVFGRAPDLKLVVLMDGKVADPTVTIDKSSEKPK